MSIRSYFSRLLLARKSTAPAQPNAYDAVAAFLGSANNNPAPQPTKLPKPATGEQSSGQTPLIPPGYNLGALTGLYQQAGGSLWAGGLGFGSFNNLWNAAFPGSPFNFAGSWFTLADPSNPAARRGSYGLYRLMDFDPTIRLVQALIRGPIVSSQWTIAARDGIQVVEGANKGVIKNGRVVRIPKAWLDAMGDMLLPLRQSLMPELLRYLSSGMRPFERVYERRNGLMWLTKLKPLLPDWTTILDGGKGNFGGIVARGASLDARKSWILSNDVEAGNLYGLSRHEAAIDPWMDGQYSRVRSALLQAKVSGVVPIVYYRPGTTPVNNVPTDNSLIAKSIMNVLFGGSGACVPTTEYTDAELQEHPEFANLAPWKIDFMQAGDCSPALAGIREDRDFQDARKVRAWCWPERAMLEARRGGLGQGDSKTHSDAGEADLELIDDDIAQQLSVGQPLYDVPGVADEITALNWGEEYRGCILVRPVPLVDSKVSVYTSLIDAAMGNQQLAPLMAQTIDWPATLAHLDIKTVDDLREKMPALLKTLADQQQQAADAKKAQVQNALAGKTQVQVGAIPNGKDSNSAGTGSNAGDNTGKAGGRDAGPVRDRQPVPAGSRPDAAPGGVRSRLSRSEGTVEGEPGVLPSGRESGSGEERPAVRPEEPATPELLRPVELSFNPDQPRDPDGRWAAGAAFAAAVNARLDEYRQRAHAIAKATREKFHELRQAGVRKTEAARQAAEHGTQGHGLEESDRKDLADDIAESIAVFGQRPTAELLRNNATRYRNGAFTNVLDPDYHATAAAYLANEETPLMRIYEEELAKVPQEHHEWIRGRGPVENNGRINPRRFIPKVKKR